MAAANYKGPIVYIVHSPSQKPEPEAINHPLEAKDINHLKKIEKLLRFAKEHGLPVFWEVINEYQEKRMDGFFKRKGIEKGTIHLLRGTEEPKNIIARCAELGITPTRVLLSGLYRERCCAEAMERLRKDFPPIEIIVLKGDYNLSAHARTDISYFKPEEVGRFKKRKEAIGARTAKLSRRLLRP